jgi:hypothetical protein
MTSPATCGLWYLAARERLRTPSVSHQNRPHRPLGPVHSAQLWPTRVVFLLRPKDMPPSSVGSARRRWTPFSTRMELNRRLDSTPPAAAWPTVSPPHPYKTCPHLCLTAPHPPLPSFPHLRTSSALSSRNSGRHLSPPSPGHLSPSSVSCQPL